MRSTTAALIAGLTVLTALVVAAPALAYDELADDHPLSGTRECYECHGLLQGETTQTPVPGSPRTGPHGGYTATTSKCSTCHTTHRAPEGGFKLLPAATVEDTCFTCHDGTGGRGVYGVIEARTNLTADEISGHAIGTANTIPGGDPNDPLGTGEFPADVGPLTCSFCHAVHGAGTVEPFVGDRYRDSDVDNDGASLDPDNLALHLQPSDRLLRMQPVGGAFAVTRYGGDWCASCHQGRAGSMSNNHPTYSGLDYHYGNVIGVQSYDSTQTAEVPLGGSNLGYVMPETRPEGSAPICQQCHEDARDVGPASYGETLTVSVDQQFTITRPDGRQANDNPRFQTFPHESNVVDLLLAPADGLCLNCHTDGSGPPGAHTP